jgi:2-polyprenylphenol hydroxylase and related flavodoxin oxidoreductases
VTEPLKELCEDTKGKPDMVIAIGPPIMMKFCALTTKPYGVKTVVSLNIIMVDGTGMCGGCRVTIGGKTKFVCVDGPEFDGHEVDWNNMLQRMGAFKPQEQEALHRFGANDGHKCNIDKMADAKAKESK